MHGNLPPLFKEEAPAHRFPIGDSKKSKLEATSEEAEDEDADADADEDEES